MTLRMSKRFLIVLLAGIIPAAAISAETVSTAKDRTALALTIYESDLAVISERRKVRLKGSSESLALQDVTANLQPETVQISGGGLRLTGTRFAYDLLTPANLMERFIGREVMLVRRHPTTGADQEKRARLLSVANGVPVFSIDGVIETGGSRSPWRIRYDKLPDGLRERPTLIAEIESARSGEQTLDIAYLSGGLSWRADYVALYDEDASSLSLTGLASLSNTSGAGFNNARLRLISGQINRARHRPPPKAMRAMAMEADAMIDEVAPVQSFEYYAYDLPRPVTLADRETRQLPFLARKTLKASREYRLDASRGMGWRHLPGGEQKANAGVILNLKNETARPLPRGVVRIYGNGDESLQLLGEDALGHVSEGAKIELTVGQAFDVTGERVQVRQDRLGRNQHSAEWAITVRNAKPRMIEVRVIEPMPGDWTMESSNHKHERVDARRAAWTLKVPAKGEKKLEYKVSWK